MAVVKKILDEDFVRRSIVTYLSGKGWDRNLREKSLTEHGVDISVRHHRYGRRWLVEAKGDSRSKITPRSRQENNFIHSLGQILTRMRVEKGRNPRYKYTHKYGVGFPSSYESLVTRRLPWAVCHKLNLFVFLVDEYGRVSLMDWKSLKTRQAA